MELFYPENTSVIKQLKNRSKELLITIEQRKELDKFFNYHPSERTVVGEVTEFFTLLFSFLLFLQLALFLNELYSNTFIYIPTWIIVFLILFYLPFSIACHCIFRSHFVDQYYPYINYCPV